MLLHALVERAKADEAQGRALPPFYAMQQVWYRLDLDSNGRPVSLQAVRDPDNPKRGLELAIPYVNRPGSTPKALPLDRGDFVFGIPAAGKPAERAARAHEAYRALIGEAARETGDPALRSIQEFLVEHLDEVAVPEDFDASKFVAIYVSGKLPVAGDAIQEWWSARQLGTGEDARRTDRCCAVCGSSSLPVESVSTAIRGLTGIGGKATMGIVTANDDVFERHGMKRASGASLCVTCGERSHQALNLLIADPARGRVLGHTKVLWWSTHDCGDILGAIVEGDTDESVGPFVDSILRGTLAAAPNAARFYAVTLGANVNRVVVRDWLDTSLPQVIGRVAEWLRLIEIVDHDGVKIRHFGIFALIAALAPPGSGPPLARVSPLLADEVLRCALVGSPLPDSLVAQCLLRIRATQGTVTVPRAAILKAYLTTRHPKETPMPTLDLESVDVGYRCGRLLAVLDRAAYAATNVHLVDRSYAAASTAPAATFVQLLKLHQAHLHKLRRDSPGLAAVLQASVEEVVGGLTDIPRTFAPTEQARFALGLYHQEAYERQARAARAVRGRSTVDNDNAVATDDAITSEENEDERD